MRLKQKTRSWKKSAVGILLIGAVLFGVLLASCPALHAALHHHKGHDGAGCMACLLSSGSVELASVDTPISQEMLKPPPQRIFISGSLNLQVRDVPKYILDHAPPTVS